MLCLPHFTTSLSLSLLLVEFSSFPLFGTKQYFCTSLTLLTEPAFPALESLDFTTDEYFTEDPRVFLFLTSNANLDTGVAVVGYYTD